MKKARRVLVVLLAVLMLVVMVTPAAGAQSGHAGEWRGVEARTMAWSDLNRTHTLWAQVSSTWNMGTPSAVTQTRNASVPNLFAHNQIWTGWLNTSGSNLTVHAGGAR